MSQTTLDRLRARGTVVIEADADGYHLSWWPTGQKGNFLVARGGSGPVLEPLVVAMEEATRPPSRDWDDARWHRERQAEHDAAWRQRAALAACDNADRIRERRSREAEEWRITRRSQIARRERDRVKRVLAS